MIISHKYKFIYIRNPKTATSSIGKYLESIDPDCISSDKTTIHYGHETYEEVKDLISKDVFDSYFKFTFMRNPKDWFISQYVMNKDYYHHSNERIHILLNDDFILNSPVNNTIDYDDFIMFYVMLTKWFKKNSQLSWVNENLDFIGSFENINEDFEKIKGILKLPDDEPLPKLNNNQSHEYKLSEKSEQLFNILYEKDNELYQKLFHAK